MLFRSGLAGIVPSAAQRVRKEGGQFEERLRLDGANGFLVTEYGLGAAYNPQISAKLADVAAFNERMRSLLTQSKEKFSVGKTIALKGEGLGGHYALYTTSGPESGGKPAHCLFALVGYRFGILATDPSFDTYVLVNYCAETVPEAALAQFLRTVKPRPAAPPQRPKS